MPWVVHKYGCPYDWAHVRSGHPSGVLPCSPRTEIIPSLWGSRGQWTAGWGDEKGAVKERRWDLEISACCVWLDRTEWVRRGAADVITET